MRGYDDFVAFVHARAWELRREAHQVTGDDRLADRLLVRALARVAQRFASRDEVPDIEEAGRQAFDAIARETPDVLRGADAPGDLADDLAGHDDGGHHSATSLELADAAWRRGARLRRGRRRRILAGVAAAIVLFAGYQVATTAEDPPPPIPPDPTTVGYLGDHLDALPAADVLGDAPLWTGERILPADIDPAAPAVPLSEGAPDRIAAAVQADPNDPVRILGGDGQWYEVDTAVVEPYSNEFAGGPLTRKSISPSGTRLALLQGASVLVVPLDGDPVKVPMPQLAGGTGEAYDVAWFGGDGDLLVTQGGSSSIVDVATGESAVLPFTGADAVLPASANEPLLTLTPGAKGAQEPFRSAVDWIPAPDGAVYSFTWESEGQIAETASWLSRFGTYGVRYGDLVAGDCRTEPGGIDVPEGDVAHSCVAVHDIAAGTLKRGLVGGALDEADVRRAGLIGWLDGETLLLSQTDGATGRTVVLAWTFTTGALHLVSAVNGRATIVLGPRDGAV